MEKERISDLLFKSIDSSSTAVRATAASISNMFFDPFEMNPKLDFSQNFYQFLEPKFESGSLPLILKTLE